MSSTEEYKIVDFNKWFNEIVDKAELADLRYNIKGTIVYRPWCVSTMSKMFWIYENKLNETGHEQVIMPCLIPEENFKKEAEHVEGFTPNVFWVTEHGDEKFEERYALRPTSETAFYYMFKYWVQSYKDLPLKTYQRANIFRYETKATKPFFRAREFYWFETHNVFETLDEAKEQVLQDMQISEDILHDKFGIPFIFFKRPEWDKFPGAIDTFAADTIMPNGKILQLPSTHLLGDKFTKAFDVKYKDKDGNYKYPMGTCYGPGISRIYGGLISIHGDKKGLRLPFELAPIHIIILPLYFKEADTNKIEELCVDLAEDLEKLGYVTRIDNDKEKTPKERFDFWEMKGVPIRLEVGPKDLENHTLTIFRRDLNTKEVVSLDDAFKKIKEISQEFTINLKAQADKEFEKRIVSVTKYEDLKTALDDGMLIRIPLCSTEMDGKECADKLKADTDGADVRGERMDIEDLPGEDDVCVVCGKKAKAIVYIGRSY